MARVIQDSPAVARSCVYALLVDEGREFAPLIPVEGTVHERGPAWRLSHEAEDSLSELDTETGRMRQWPSREQIARGYVDQRGRISSTELASLTRAASSNVGRVLKDSEDAGLVEPSWPSRRGRGVSLRLDARSERRGTINARVNYGSVSRRARLDN